MLSDYFKIQKSCYEKHGDRTLLFIQVGTFYEFYSGDDDPMAPEISELLGIRLTLMDTSIRENSGTYANPYVIGFPCLSVDKYQAILLHHNYIILFYNQDKINKSKRILSQPITPLTLADANLRTDAGRTNRILFIYFECFKNRHRNEKVSIISGIASIDVITGNNDVEQIIPDDTLTGSHQLIEELYRILSSLHPRELQIYINYTSKDIDTITFEKYIRDSLELDSYPILSIVSTVDKNYLNCRYQEEMLIRVFRPEKKVFTSPTEFKIHTHEGSLIDIFIELNLDKIPYAVNAYVLLLQYCHERNEVLLNRIKKPTILLVNNVGYLNLTYNAIVQLNVVESNVTRVNYRVNKKHSYNTLLSVLDNTSTPMGRRVLRSRLVRPIVDPKILCNRYNIIDQLRNASDYRQSATSILKQLYDLEKINLKLIKGTIIPKDYCNLINSCKLIIELINLTIPQIITPDRKPTELYQIFPNNKEISSFNDLFKLIYETFDLDILQECNIVDGSFNCKNSPLKLGKHLEIDRIQYIIDYSLEKLDIISQHLERFVGGNVINIGSVSRKVKKGRSIDDDEDEELINTKDLGIYLTERNANKVKMNIHNIDALVCGNIKIDSRNKKYRISSEVIDGLCDTILESRKIVGGMISDYYRIHLEYLNQTYNLEAIIKFVTELDLVICGAFNSLKYNYFKPILKPEIGPKSYLTVKNLRHPIIERIIQTEYIPNDVSLNSDHHGIILYGCNSTGKTALTTSIGLSIIMAQSGSWVPGELQFYPYNRIITRLSGNDDILKGHSSFVVEMIELRSILQYADESTLILGDELCRGTESLSAMSLTIATIDHLISRKSSFIFSSHLHEIPKHDIIKNHLKDGFLRIYHLETIYDESSQNLKYNRKLKDGSGESIYGIEVAKSLDMGQDFITKASNIRKTLLGESTALVNPTKSNYNSQVFIDNCIFCGSKSNLESHHLKEQSLADSNGFIGHTHKDSSFNVRAVCRACHTNYHTKKIKVESMQTPAGTILNFNQ